MVVVGAAVVFRVITIIPTLPRAVVWAAACMLLQACVERVYVMGPCGWQQGGVDEHRATLD